MQGSFQALSIAVLEEEAHPWSTYAAMPNFSSAEESFLRWAQLDALSSK